VTKTSVRVLYFGMLGEFSRAPLTALLKAGIDVCGVIVPAARTDSSGQSISRVRPEPPRSDILIIDPYLEANIAHIAWRHGLPVFEVNRLDHLDILSVVRSLQPDVACVACFSRRIPASLLALPRYGFLNVHPSLLPTYRGPSPLFWTFRDGEGVAGVTIHFMDEGLDTGDIVAQEPIELPDGISGVEADRMCSQLGGRLLVDVVQALGGEASKRRPQPDGGSYYPSPSPADFAISATWSARRAFNFMRGTAEWGRAYPVEVDGDRIALTSAISYSAGQTLEQPCILLEHEAWIQFDPGVLRARLHR